MRARACVRTHANTNYATTPSWNGHFAILLFEMLLFLFWCCVSHVKLMMVNDSIDFDLLVVFFSLSLSNILSLFLFRNFYVIYWGTRAHRTCAIPYTYYYSIYIIHTHHVWCVRLRDQVNISQLTVTK